MLFASFKRGEVCQLAPLSTYSSDASHRDASTDFGQMPSPRARLPRLNTNAICGTRPWRLASVLLPRGVQLMWGPTVKFLLSSTSFFKRGWQSRHAMPRRADSQLGHRSGRWYGSGISKKSDRRDLPSGSGRPKLAVAPAAPSGCLLRGCSAVWRAASADRCEQQGAPHDPVVSQGTGLRKGR